MSKFTHFLFQYVLPESFYFSKEEPHRCPKCWGTHMTNNVVSPFQDYRKGIEICCKKCGDLVGVDLEGSFYSAYGKGVAWL